MTHSFKFTESAVAQGHIRILHSNIGKLNFPISIFFLFKSRSHNVFKVVKLSLFSNL